MINKAEYQFKELEVLRNELNNLKECQVKYFTFSITATGIIFGLIVRFGDSAYSGLIYLLPLTVLLPCWLVFFDKAKTITRIVAYYRFLESVVLNQLSFNFIGWENSLMRFRDWELANKETEFFPEEECDQFNQSGDFWDKIKPSVGNYWFLINLSFTGLVAVCVGIPLFKLMMDNLTTPTISCPLYKSILITFALLFFIFTFTYNLKVYLSLTNGRNSYDTNMMIWCEVFDIDHKKIRCQMPKKIRLVDLFSRDFMKTYTSFIDFSEMINRSYLNTLEKNLLFTCLFNESNEKYEIFYNNRKWNSYINQYTAFNDWNEMLKTARAKYFKKKEYFS